MSSCLRNTAVFLSLPLAGRLAHTNVNYVICGFWTGWRPNEACALKWPRVDFHLGKILIREGKVWGLTGIPKSSGSLRDIDMLPPVRQALQEQKALSFLMGDEVFLNEYQRPLDQDFFRQQVWAPPMGMGQRWQESCG